MDQNDLNEFAIYLGGTKTAMARLSRDRIVDRNVAATDGNDVPGKQVGAMADLPS